MYKDEPKLRIEDSFIEQTITECVIEKLISLRRSLLSYY